MDVYRPGTLQEALELLKRHDAAPAAGCTDLLVHQKHGKPVKQTLVDITGIQELRRVRQTPGGISLGGACTFAQLEGLFSGSPYACLSEAAAEVGGPQIRNRGTLSGNLASGSPASDGAVALLALDAELTLLHADGIRTLRVVDFFEGYAKTALRPGELIAQIRLPARGGRSRFVKVGKRNALAISVLSLAISLELEGDAVRDVRIALGAAAPTPLRAYETEAALTGRALDREAIREAAALVSSEMRPISDIRASAEYRRGVAGALLSDLLNRRCL